MLRMVPLIHGGNFPVLRKLQQYKMLRVKIKKRITLRVEHDILQEIVPPGCSHSPFLIVCGWKLAALWQTVASGFLVVSNQKQHTGEVCSMSLLPSDWKRRRR